MNQHYAHSRKIDPSRPAIQRPDGTLGGNDRVEIGPTPLAFAEWEAAGLTLPNIPAMRQYRLDRLVAALAQRDYAGVLLFDPLNIRYASDTTNMQLWNSHNPFRACLVLADGYMVMWDFKRLGDLLTAFNPLVRETRRGTASFFYFTGGDGTAASARYFSAEILDLLAEHCGDNRRLAVDKIMVHGLKALEARGIEVMEGEEVTEKARSIKGPDEILAMRCAIHACEAAMAEMQAAMAPGMTEDDVWAELHAGNIRRGGEWIETRLLASGPRTNPWFQECGPRVISEGEILAFDTDLVGCWGICTDMSRTWIVGDAEPTAEQKRVYRIAVQHIEENTAMLRPGMSFREICHGGHQLPEEFVELRYGAKMHGVGLCDEWPLIGYPQDWQDGHFDYETAPGMCMCPEVYLGTVGGSFGVKLEDQVLITETGHERLSSYPWEARLLS
ncbi:MAG: dimethylsulfonioproprionate lyase DddP [Pseudomonadota bacterium]